MYVHAFLFHKTKIFTVSLIINKLIMFEGINVKLKFLTFECFILIAYFFHYHVLKFKYLFDVPFSDR